jgi:hypothetical protein
MALACCLLHLDHHSSLKLPTMLRVLTSIDSRGSRLRRSLPRLLNSCLLLLPSGTDRSALKGGSASLTGLLLLLAVLALSPAASA